MTRRGRDEHKLLAAMRNNPRGDWRIEDLATVSRSIAGVLFLKPTGGSHYKVAHPRHAEILTVPARRPLKPVYVRRFVSMIDNIIGKTGSEEDKSDSDIGK